MEGGGDPLDDRRERVGEGNGVGVFLVDSKRKEVGLVINEKQLIVMLFFKFFNKIFPAADKIINFEQ